MLNRSIFSALSVLSKKRNPHDGRKQEREEILRNSSKRISHNNTLFSGEWCARAHRVYTATVLIGDSNVMISDEMHDMPAMPTMLRLYVKDVDKMYRQALSSNGITIREPVDEFLRRSFSASQG